MSAGTHLDPESVELHAMGQGAAAEHLASCADCRGAVARAQARRRILDGLVPPHLHEAVFTRVEKQLFDAPREPVLRWRWIPAFALAAGVAALAFIVWRGEPSPAPTAPLPLAQAPAPVAPEPVAGVITLLEGQVEREEHGQWVALAGDARLAQGDHLRTAEGRVAFDVAPGRGVVFEPHGELKLDELVKGGVRLSLESGQVYCQVAPLTDDERYFVRAGPRYVRVVGTSFVVTRRPHAMAVEVEHGTVQVEDSPAASQGVRVPAPGRLEAEDDAPLAGMSASTLSDSEAAALRADPAWQWARRPQSGLLRLDVLGLEAGSLVELDQAGWGPSPVSAWLEPGTHLVRARLKGHPERVAEVKLDEKVGAFQFSFPPAPPPVHQKPKPLVPPTVVQAIRAVERDHHRTLTYCYEHALKRNPSIEGSLVLELTLTPEGAVEEVTVASDSGALLPDELSTCILDEVRGWTFPAGAPPSFQLPLQLTPKN